MKLIFMGTPEFSVTALDALVAAGHEIVRVYTQPPRKAGRGKSLRPTPVAARAEALGLDIHHPISLKGHGDEIASLGADAAVVVAYGLLLPQDVLDAPRLGCLNIHASLLPRWRGAAPIHRAIMAGDLETGVAIMQMEAGLDTGPVYKSETTSIGPSDTTQILHDRLADMGASLVVEVLSQFETLTPMPQAEEGVTYAAKIEKAEARIDWTRPNQEIDCQIRGLSPFPGAWTTINGERIKLHLSERDAANGAAGTTLDDALTIACGSGAVRILRLQRAGRPAMDRAEFLKGFRVPKGTRLE